MSEVKIELETLFKGMLEEVDNLIEQKDEILIQDLKDFNMEIQWILNGIKGYQVFENGDYSYKFGGEIEQPDVTLVIRDKDLASRFLKGERLEFDLTPSHKGGIKITHTEGWKILDTPEGKKRVPINRPFITARFNREKDFHPYILSKIPIFRSLVETRVNEEDIGFYISINSEIPPFENQVLPLEIIQYFINKACNIIVMHSCGCRVHYDCQDYNKNIGCMYMGKDTQNILMPEDKGHVVTKQEALEIVKNAIEDGLIPLIGRAMDEAVGFGVEDTGRFFSMCFCCPCCCTNIRNVKHGSSILHFFHKVEGLNVVVDKNACIGCEECLKACVFDSMEMIDGIANIDEDRCVGCGRCVTVCPNYAISIAFDNPSSINNLIAEIESHVDVS